MAALYLGVTLAAPQNFVRVLPADFSGQGFRAFHASDLGSHALHTVTQVKIFNFSKNDIILVIIQIYFVRLGAFF